MATDYEFIGFMGSGVDGVRKDAQAVRVSAVEILSSMSVDINTRLTSLILPPIVNMTSIASTTIPAINTTVADGVITISILNSDGAIMLDVGALGYGG